MRRIRTVYSSSRYKNNVGELIPCPSITLQGKVVANLGFKKGDKVLIRGKSGLIVVKLLKQE